MAININLIKKVRSFFKNANSLKYIDPNIFESINNYKEINDIDFNDYYLEYIRNLPKLDFETVVKISREVYQLYGKENEFDRILETLKNNYSIDNGSLNIDDDKCITKASENKILLSGTYYDVVLLCHEIGHKLRFDNSMNVSDLMDSFLFETPAITIELTANNYLRDNYGVDINAEQLRKMHVLSIIRENSIENNIFIIIIYLLKERKLSIINLYNEFIKNPNIVNYLNRQGTTIDNCVCEAISEYSYDIGYILGNYINSCENKIEILNQILKYKDKGINMPFTIDDRIIEDALRYQRHSK